MIFNRKSFLLLAQNKKYNIIKINGVVAKCL